jgi:4-cresol dehydrogenase (hydroxylating)
LAVARRVSAPVYPVSSGKNWGYGSKVPASDECVLMDLSRMNRIVAFSEEHAWITVEPGVTQREVLAFLKTRGAALILDCTGASPDSSVIGNTMERGFGHTPYGDHFAHISNLEVVLPNGECIETGFGRYNDIAATPVYRWGVGPILDGLFSQSNLGIVTRMTIFLMPKPEYFQAFFFRCKEDEGLGDIIDALRPLRLDGTLRNALHIGNDYKVLSGIQQYPWTRTGGRTPLTTAVMREFRQEMDFGAWNGSAGLYGTHAQVAEARRLVKKALRGKVDKLQFLDERTLRLAERFAGPCKWVTGWDLRRVLELVRPIFGLMQGIPTDFPLRSVYWRKNMQVPVDMNPDRDRCGLIWCAPVAPIEGGHARRLSKISSDVMLRHGFEPMLSITLVTERTLTCVISISYDRDMPGEDERAMKCHRELIDALTSGGYHFYRLGIHMMSEIQQDNGYTRTLQALKQTLDPAGILAPGRYHPQTAMAVREQST